MSTPSTASRSSVSSPKDSNALGIEVVYQDLALCDNLDVVHNMFLGRELTKAGRLDEATMETRAQETLAGLSVRTLRSVRTHVASLSGGQRQTVAIARAVLWNSRIVILDEPTAALGVAQTEQVLKLVRRLADRGLGVVLISHNLNDVFQVADDIAVLYLGRLVAQVHTKDVTNSQVVELITTGRSGDLGLPPATARTDETEAIAVTATTTSPEPGPTATPAETPSLSTIGRDYVTRLRGGDVGSLPALLGLVVLVAVFTAVRPDEFTNAFNFANLINQSAAVIVIAMGLVFVLLLGEIDLSAGFTAGSAAAVMGVVMTRHEQPWPIALLACLATGATIGFLIGTAGRRAWASRRSWSRWRRSWRSRASCCCVIGEGGTIPYRNETILAIMNENLPIWLGLDPRRRGPRRLRRRHASQGRAARRRAGLLVPPMLLWVIKLVVISAITLGATAYLSAERSRNPQLSSLKGIPVVVVVLLVLLVVADLPAQPHRLGPPRLRRRRQRRGRSPRRHQRGPDEARPASSSAPRWPRSPASCWPAAPTPSRPRPAAR